jgi:hypothetical protein
MKKSTRSIAIVLAAAMLSQPITALAQTRMYSVQSAPSASVSANYAVPLLVSPSVVPSSEANLGAVISPLKTGQRAPFTGVLLSPMAAASVIVTFDDQAERIKIETDRVAAATSASCTFSLKELEAKTIADKAVLSAQLDTFKTNNTALNKQLAAAEAARTNPWLWASLGAGGTALVAVGVGIFVAIATHH